jgi:hypothetical protein
MSLVGKMVSFQQPVITRKGYNHFLTQVEKVGRVVREEVVSWGDTCHTIYVIDVDGSGLFQTVVAHKVKEYRLYDYEEML